MDSTPYQSVAKPTPTPAPAPGRLVHYASAMLAEHRDSTGSSISIHDHDDDHKHHDDDDDATPITLGLAIRRTRLIAFTLIMLVLIVGFTLWFHHGIALEHFDSRDKNATEQTKLLDDYNSYSGNVATIFAKPVELFVTVAVQVIVLRFLADTFTRPEMSWRISALTLLLGAGVGYMISNGFNAMNVQLRPQEIRSIISGVDLGRANFVDPLNTTFISTNPTSEPEFVANNPVTNTVLRTMLVAETAIGAPSCKYSEFRDGVSTLAGTLDQVDRPFLNLGLPQREWQSRILQEALPTETLRLIVNPTNASINDGAIASTLPMAAARAANLFNSAMVTGTYFFPWGARRDYVNHTDLLRRYPVNDTATYNFTDSLPIMNGHLPQDPSASETAQRDFFLPAALAAAARQFARANRTKTSDIVMEFSHTQIAPNITFDALTFEVELDPALLASAVSSTDNATRYTELNQRFECPVAQHCLVRKPTYAAVKPLFDSPAQVVAFRMCTNWSGSEASRANLTITNNSVARHIGSCADDPNLFTRSLLIVSIGKRLVADALEQNVSVAADGTTERNTSMATVTNLRKIYSFTVGRLGWDTDLAEAFNADCDDGAACLGLQLPLSDPIGSSTSVKSSGTQRLLVGADAIRHAQSTLGRPASRINDDKTNLVAVAEPPELFNASAFYKAMSGDLLLPHNVREIKWDLQSVHPQCDLEAESRVMALRSQHQYMEHSLQAAYTAGTYFLFQSAVVRDEIALTATRKSLAFQRNSQSIAVWVSTPLQNMWLTLAGCLVLVVGLLCVMAKSMWFTHRDTDALANITEPHAIARVMMDDRSYPPLFLHRNVVEKNSVARVDEFAIAGLSLQQQQQTQQQNQQQHQQRRRHADSEDKSTHGPEVAVLV